MDKNAVLGSRRRHVLSNPLTDAIAELQRAAAINPAGSGSVATKESAMEPDTHDHVLAEQERDLFRKRQVQSRVQHN